MIANIRWDLDETEQRSIVCKGTERNPGGCGSVMEPLAVSGTNRPFLRKIWLCPNCKTMYAR